MMDFGHITDLGCDGPVPVLEKRAGSRPAGNRLHATGHFCCT